jgi:hypothetical protein
MLKTHNNLGQMFTLEAKMDTGSDLNWMNEDAAVGHQISYDLVEGPDLPTAKVGSGQSVSPDGIATITYTAGANPKTYNEEFYVKEGIPHDM